MLEVISREAAPDGRAPILFVHGAWHGAWCWDEYFLPYFAQRGRSVHAVSLRGHGDSPGRNKLRRTRIAQYVADVEEVAASFSQDPVVIGHSMGGLVVRRYLRKHQPPAAVMLAGVPAGGVVPTAVRILRAHPGPFLKANAGLSLYPLVATPDLARWAFFSDDMPDDDVVRHQARLQDESYVAFLDMLIDRPRPRPVDHPLLVLGGGRDRVFHPSQLMKTARRFGVEAEILPEMAHDMMLEAGWRTVADRIIDWLDDVGA